MHNKCVSGRVDLNLICRKLFYRWDFLFRSIAFLAVIRSGKKLVKNEIAIFGDLKWKVDLKPRRNS